MEPSQFPQDDFLAHLLEWVKAGGDAQNHRTEAGWSLLHIAAELCDAEAIRYLIGLGVDLEIRDDLNGWTALHFAVDSELDGQAQTGRTTNLHSVRALVEAGANVLARTYSEEMPRDIAAAYGKDALAQYDRIVA